ncbi:MAG: WecB/TagA/CpsF family glycosyltransferase [Candidatus Omnitrophica bacterium]|nr:WecB/TagA/CpsF family glycosyltransferase [Candidatus Omnitrophota bacterium]
METITLFDIPVTNCTLQEAVRLIMDILSGERPALMHFVNAHCINVSRRDPEYRQILQSTDYIFADGIGMKLAARMHGLTLLDNVNGTDLYPPLLDALDGSGRRIFLLGGDPGVAEEMQRQALQNHPDLIFCGAHHGFIPPEENGAVARQITDAQTDLLLIAMGVPRQEKWLARHFTQTGATLAMGVGGLFNFYSGAIPRAPLWMRRTGLEWLHRLLMEPGRMWKRYLIGNLVFLYHALREGIKTRG